MEGHVPLTLDAAVDQLCLGCGLCCNGVLFRDVELLPGDDAATLRSHGLPLEVRGRKTRFPQPCCALCQDNRCRIYPDRPARCRDFECALLKAVAAGHVEAAAALRTIQRTLRLAGQVRTLLRELGDSDEHVALVRRFRRLTRRMESGLPDEAAAETYGKLTLAVHDLNLQLRKSFYPG